MMTTWTFVEMMPLSAAIFLVWIALALAGGTYALARACVDSFLCGWIGHGLLGVWLAVGLGATAAFLTDMLACRLLQWCAP